MNRHEKRQIYLLNHGSVICIYIKNRNRNRNRNRNGNGNRNGKKNRNRNRNRNRAVKIYIYIIYQSLLVDLLVESGVEKHLLSVRIRL